MEQRVRRRRSRDLRVQQPRGDSGLSPASRLRIAADVHRHSTSDDDSGCVLEEYAWWPSGLKPDTVHLYFACLPDDKVPYVGSAGEKWRARQLRHQLPPQDSDARYCSELIGDEADDLRMFDRARKAECIGVGLVQRVPYDGRQRRCKGCSHALEEGEMSVQAARTETTFHPACFHCFDCRTLLVDLIYFAHEGNIYCGRHHAEQIKPRCARCDELIFGEECTEAEGRTWHLHHFQCADCGEVLGGKKYMQRNSKPVCLTCFHSSQPVLRCTACLNAIPADSPIISQGDHSWHSSARCFACCVCTKNLLGTSSYSLRDGRLYCGKNGCITEVPYEPRPSPERRLEGRPPRAPRCAPSPRLAPRPPQRAPPPPPSENIYETVLPCSSGSSPEIEKKKYSTESEKSYNYYCRTPNRTTRHHHEDVVYSTSSSDSEDDDMYLANMMAAASLSRTRKMPSPPQQTGVRMAKKKKSSRCIVS